MSAVTQADYQSALSAAITVPRPLAPIGAVSTTGWPSWRRDWHAVAPARHRADRAARPDGCLPTRAPRRPADDAGGHPRRYSVGVNLSVYTNELAAIHTVLKRLNKAGEIRLVPHASGKHAYLWQRPAKAADLEPGNRAVHRRVLGPTVPGPRSTPPERPGE